MKLTYDDYETIAYGDEWEKVGPEENVGEHRWYDDLQQGYKNKATGELIVLITHEGNNETVDMSYSEYPASKFAAEEYQVTETRYRKAA